MDHVDVSIVCPVFLCAKTVPSLVARLASCLDARKLTWEIIFVEDKCPQGSWEIIKKESARDKRVRGIRLQKNHGQHLAIFCGLLASSGDWVAIIDCDLQDPPELIPDLLEKANSEHYDAVVAWSGRRNGSRYRNVLSNAYARMMKYLAGAQFANTGNFGVYKRSLVEQIVEFSERGFNFPMMLALTGVECGYLNVVREERVEGKSSYTLASLISLALSCAVRFSSRPLLVMIYIGFLVSFVSFLIGFLLFILWVNGTIRVDGWMSIMLSIWFLSGSIMTFLGVVGIYISNIFLEVVRRPLLFVQDDVNFSNSDFRTRFKIKGSIKKL